MRLALPTNHQSAALKAIFAHRWSCGLVAPVGRHKITGGISQTFQANCSELRIGFN